MQFYCYVYYDENWQAYYVGKGQGGRMYSPKGHPDLPAEERIQVFKFEQEWQAFECEIELIAFWKRQCDGGSLLNQSTGGAGSPGVKASKETLAKLSESHKGKKHSTETRLKMSQSRAGEKNHRAKPCLITTPSGNTIEVNAIAPFCRKHNLHPGNMTLVAQGKRKHHRGYTVRYLEAS